MPAKRQFSRHGAANLAAVDAFHGGATPIALRQTQLASCHVCEGTVQLQVCLNFQAPVDHEAGSVGHSDLVKQGLAGHHVAARAIQKEQGIVEQG